MAGCSKILNVGEMLFGAGEKADSMYIVRKGALKVFFQKGNEEIVLATLTDGSIVGEMAFFDDKPRSASVRAAAQTEVTVISRADFDKLVLQLPKWVVTMLQSLSGRLRQTNEKLQKLEASVLNQSFEHTARNSKILPNQKHPFQCVTRILKLLLLSINKDGQKDGRDFTLVADIPFKLVSDVLDDEGKIYPTVLKTLEAIKFVTAKTDASRVPVLAISNRGTLVNFIEFFSKFAAALKPEDPFLSDSALELAEAILEAATTSGYESLQLSIDTIVKGSMAKGLNTIGWAEAAVELGMVPDIKLSKTDKDTFIKLNTKGFKLTFSYLKYIELFYKVKLA